MKRLSILTVLIMFASLVNSQDFRFGLKIAPNVGWVRPTTQTIKANGAAMGFSYGLTGDYYFKDNYGLNFGLSINSMGSNVMIDSVHYSATASKAEAYKKNIGYNYRLQYLELPISLKMKTNEIGYLSYFMTFGLKNSFLTNAKANIEAPGYFAADEKTLINNSENNHLDDPAYYKDDIRGYRASLLISVGAEYSLFGKSSAFAAIAWDNGFVSILKDKKSSANNSFIGLQLGFLF